MDVHTLTVIGLALNGIGGFMLIFISPPVPPREVMKDGREKFAQTYVHEFSPPR